MGRSFYRAEQIGTATYYHQPSEEHYAVIARGGRFYQRRHQLTADGRETNLLERSIDFVLGSGNHARTFLHRNARGELVELPLAWYSENGGTWAMNPGYDRSDHLGFQRKLDRECIFCHAASADPAPIDCQRCHGPGDQHARRPQSGSIVNPARLDAQRRLEVCLQCHLESSSRALPYAIRRFGRGYFSYRPGEPLSDYMLHFERAGGPGDTFEINDAGYGFLQSACYRRSNGALTCTTCHNPHEASHDPEATERYQRVCRNCHATLPARHTAAAACLQCHMPKRRTDDVVHAVMTDHSIPRRKPVGDPLAPKHEQLEAATIYRGKVALLYPPQLAKTAETELYMSLAQVIDASDYDSGIPRLRRALDMHPDVPAEFYAGLAESYSKTGKPGEALRYWAEALGRQPNLTDARQHYALALQQAGRTADALQVLARAPGTPAVLNELGYVLLHSGRLEEAQARFRRALAADPDLPEVWLNLGTTLSQQGKQEGAIDALRKAVRLRPNLLAARSNLASLLNARGDYAEAREHFRFAIRIDPTYALVRYNYGRVLVEHGEFAEAEVELRAALRLDPGLEAAKVQLELARKRMR
jgi:predicted CXXCH cytochrome family protein